MSMRRLPLVAVFLAALSAPAFAQHFAAPGQRSDDYYLRDPDRAAPRRADRPRTGQPVELSGTVASVDRGRQSVRLRARDGLRTLEFYDGTRLLFESGRRAAWRDVRAGDDLRVSGVERNGRIVAERVTLRGPAGARDPDGDTTLVSRQVVLVGTIRTPTYDVSRRIKVRTAEGDVTVEVPPRTPIYQYGDRASVHELDRGDRVRIVGEWVGENRLRASRIDAGPPPRPSKTSKPRY